MYLYCCSRLPSIYRVSHDNPSFVINLVPMKNNQETFCNSFRLLLGKGVICIMPEPLNTRYFQVWFGCLIFSVSILLLMLFLSMKGIYLQIGLPPVGIPHYLLKCLFIFSTCISGIYIIHS